MVKYKKFRNRLGNIRYVHKVAMERKLGRKLNKYERVHHINGDKLDNRLSNLKVIDLRKHTKNHYKNGDYHILTKAEMRKGAEVTNKKFKRKNKNVRSK